MASALRCGWSNTDKKSAPRASIMAAASFSTLKKSMADGSTPPRITISTARFWSTPLNNR